MQELLLIADVLITDYSSCSWDFSLTSKPCFIFAPDLDYYLTNRGIYTPIDTWPYPLARTNEELVNNIINFEKREYDVKVKKHYEDLGSYEQGSATSKMTGILQEIFKN
jgi:CDP-glycerol glycerophosphotransferase